MRRISRRDTWARRRKDKDRPKEELDVRLVSIRRVSKVKKGGKTLRMSVMAVIGDKEGNVGVAVAKGKDVRDAQNKAINKAKKNLIKVPLKGQTIPHEVTSKFKAAKVFLRPASPGTGVIAGGAVRAVVEVAGIKDILSKRLGSNNTITNVYATFEALKSLRLKRL
ncbi:30S ribosomal protein S5 [Candidatus Dojkabacteria bacterium]|nr:30S ribosomal protein S5 [Candidatus Dojkabacteria bacterium]